MQSVLVFCARQHCLLPCWRPCCSPALRLCAAANCRRPGRTAGTRCGAAPLTWLHHQCCGPQLASRDCVGPGAGAALGLGRPPAATRPVCCGCNPASGAGALLDVLHFGGCRMDLERCNGMQMWGCSILGQDASGHNTASNTSAPYPQLGGRVIEAYVRFSLAASTNQEEGAHCCCCTQEVRVQLPGSRPAAMEPATISI